MGRPNGNGTGQQTKPNAGLQLELDIFRAAQSFALNATLEIRSRVNELLRDGAGPGDIEVIAHSCVSTVEVKLRKPKSNILVPGLATDLRGPKRGG